MSEKYRPKELSETSDAEGLSQDVQISADAGEQSAALESVQDITIIPEPKVATQEQGGEESRDQQIDDLLESIPADDLAEAMRPSYSESLSRIVNFIKAHEKIPVDKAYGYLHNLYNEAIVDESSLAGPRRIQEAATKIIDKIRQDYQGTK
jgi:hypothetical protein